MAWELTAYSVVAFASAAVYLGLIAVGWRRRWQTAAPAFVALMAGAFCWSVAAAVQYGFSSLAAQLVWARVAVAASGTVPALFLVFSLRYAGRDDLLTRPRVAFLVGEAGVFAAVALTNQWHHVLWRNPTLASASGTSVVQFTLAAAYYVHVTYAYVLVAAGLAALGVVFFTGSALHTRQSGLMIVGALPPFLSHVAYTLHLGPWPWLDLTPFTLVVTGVLYGFVLFHLDLLERTPVAQRRAIELVGDGLLVVDAAGRIVDANEVARRVLDLDADEATFADVFPDRDVQALHGTTRTETVGGTRCAYDVLVSDLTDHHGRSAGSAVVLRDVTDRYRYEQRLEVANRVLRHNLRNDMNVILGNARLLADDATDERAERAAENIVATASDLVSLSEKARELSALSTVTSSDDATVDVSAVVASLVGEFRDDHQAVSFELDASDEVATTAVSRHALQVAVRNVLENAVRHNDAAEPTVAVSVFRDDAACVRVSDNGPGLPPAEQNFLTSDTETPVQHSAGLGLWLANWVVRSVGGTVSFDTGVDEGTTITLVLGPRESST